MKKLFVIGIICLLPVIMKGQEYPLPILIGETKTLKAENDTLWVLTHKQFKIAVTKAKDLMLANDQILILKDKVSTMEKTVIQKDSISSILTRDRDYYKKYWETTENDLKLVGKQLNHQKFFTKLSIAGIVVAFIAGFYIAK